MSNINKRILTINSHVVHGHVGNCATTFPLQLYGYVVNPINSVHYSTHVAYANGFKGTVMTDKELHDIITGLEANNLIEGYSHLLSGQVATSLFIQAMSEIQDKLKVINPGLKWVCDPVLGDNGQLQVSPDLVDAYIKYVLPKAFMITPNQFEAEQLASTKIASEADLKICIDKLIDQGPKIVVITSTDFGNNKEYISLYAACKNDEIIKQQKVDVPVAKRIDGQTQFMGTGDLLSSMFLVQQDIQLNDFPRVIDYAINILQQTIIKTIENPITGPCEINIIGSRSVIINPGIKLKCYQIFN